MVESYSRLRAILADRLATAHSISERYYPAAMAVLSPASAAPRVVTLCCADSYSRGDERLARFSSFRESMRLPCCDKHSSDETFAHLFAAGALLY